MFPAYSEKAPEDDKEAQFNWLQNPSYTSKASEGIAVYTEQSKSEILLVNKSHQNTGDNIAEEVCLSELESAWKKRKKDPRELPVSTPSQLAKVGTQQLNAGYKEKVKTVLDVPKEPFWVDHKPDQANLVFNALPNLKIAKYIRKLPCLGLKSKDQYCLVQCSRKKKSTKQHLKKRYYSRLKDLYADANMLDISKILQGNSNKRIGAYPTNNYLPLEQTTNVNMCSSKMSDVNRLNINDKKTSSYLKGNELKLENVDDILRTHEVSLVESEEQYSCRVNVEFNKHLREFPHDIKKWVEFIEFQDDVTLAFWSANRVAQKYILEKKMAILDKAIASNPNSIELLLRKFELCGEVWDTSHLNEEWKKLLFLHPNNTWLWKKYLIFFQTQFSTFTVSRFVKLFSNCFEKLKGILEGKFLSHKPMANMEEHMIDIFSHFCHILRQSGYHERAIANFQALIEFNFFTPINLFEKFATFDEWLAFFEPFWDSGVPRFGEVGALGWRHAMEHKEAPLPSEKTLEKNEDDVLDPLLSTSENWLKLERCRNSRHWLPLKPSESANECEDSDRIILFDDIKNVLFCLKKEDGKFLLILRFLDFLGVCVEPHLQFTCDYIGCHHPTFVEHENQLLLSNQHFAWRFFSSVRKESTLKITNLFLYPKSKAFPKFIEQVVKQSMILFNREYEITFITILLAEKCKRRNISSEPKKQFHEAKKFIKNILKCKGKRNDFRLFCEYAKLEWQSGNILDARKIFNIALELKSSNESDTIPHEIKEDQLDLCYLHRIAAELELCEEMQKTTKPRTTQILMNLGNGLRTSLDCTVEISPSSLLKSRARYKGVLNNLITKYQDLENDHKVERRLLSSCGQLLTEWTICFALFEYVTEGLVCANDVFDKTLRFLEESMKENATDTIYGLETSLQRSRLNVELLYMSYVKLHVLDNNNGSPLGKLRFILRKALNLFPENRHFNSLFLDMESKSYIAGRLRRHYDARFRSKNKANCVSLTYAIIADLERQALLESQITMQGHSLSGDTGTVNRLRTLFLKTVNLSQMKNCVLFWRLYMKFEVLLGNYDEGKAIFYKAVQQCPWAKVLYFDALQYFPNDVQEISDILTEKEIRVRVPMEEILFLLDG